MRTRDEVSRWKGGSSKKKRSINLESGEQAVGPEFSHGSEEYSLQRDKMMQEGGTEEESSNEGWRSRQE